MESEGPASGNYGKYLGVARQKAAQLKALTDNLFDASKAASGDMKAEAAPVDLAAMVRQGLGEMDAEVRASGLDFRVDAPEGGVLAMADGKLMWRVFENLVTNACKYALRGTRVYVALRRAAGGGALATFKNVSAEELNVPAEELMRRFARGDASRHGEGAGLGLSIAKSLTELMGGRFEVRVDGDLFAASVWMPEPPAGKAAQGGEAAA